MKTAVNRITIALSATAFFISAGCGISSLGKDSNAQPIVSQDLHLAAGAPLQSFQTGFYAFALKNCAQCHSSDQTPLFAVSSVTAAYSNAISYLNVSNPEKSEFISQATNGHCGVVGCSNPANAPTVANDMSKWATAINDANNPTTGGPTPVVCTNGTIAASTNITYFSVPIPIPSNIPGIGDSGTIMRWYLSNPNLIPADSSVAGAAFEIQIQLLNPTTYRIILPTVILPKTDSAVIFSGIHVLVQPTSQTGEGCELVSAESWAGIDTTVEPSTQTASTISKISPTVSMSGTSGSVLLEPTLSVDLPVLSTSDSISIGFESLGP